MARAASAEVQEVAAAATGDEAAFARIVAVHHDDMRRVCRFITRDDALADDATQQAWTIVWRKLGSLRDPTRLRPWLISIAANEAKAVLRKHRRRDVEVPPEGIDPAGGIDPATGVDRLDLRAAMAKLDPDDRVLLAMRYVAGFDATELGSAIGLSPSGTRVRLMRLLDRLRKELDHG